MAIERTPFRRACAYSKRGVHKRPAVAALAALLAVAFVAAACGSSSNKSSNTTTSTTAASGQAPTGSASFDPSPYKSVSATLNGSGSTFQQNFNNAAIGALAAVLPNIKITYGGGGSGKGKSDLGAQTVDWAGTDSTLKPNEVAALKGGPFFYFPTVVAPITVSYNLPSVHGLKLDGPTLAGIFSTQIKTWNDPKIAALNGGMTLPSDPIQVCHRAEASGTTSNFTKFLQSAGGPGWTLGQGDTITWPAGTQGAQGNGGVAQCIKSKTGAVGYVDFADAKNAGLTYASVKNKNGEYEQPTLDGASKAAAGATVAADLTYSPIDPPGAGVYPITSPTWIIAYQKQTDPQKGKALQAFLKFIFTDGQKLAPGSNYAPVPQSLATKALAQVDRLQIS
jgi:phosphate transport system substrate-binding protein